MRQLYHQICVYSEGYQGSVGLTLESLVSTLSRPVIIISKYPKRNAVVLWLTSCAIWKSGRSERIPLAQGHGVYRANDPVLLQVLGPFEHNLIIAIVAGHKQEVGAIRLGILAEDVLCSSSLVIVGRLDDDRVLGWNSPHALRLRSIVDLVGTFTGLAARGIGLALIVEDERALVVGGGIIKGWGLSLSDADSQP